MHLLLRVSNYSSSLIQLQYAYMAQDNDTSSSFTVLPDDFTEQLDRLGPDLEHTSRRTKTGFLVSGDRLRGYVPTPPSKRTLGSWIYRHGERITRISDFKRMFLCRICYDKEQSLVITIPEHHTQVARHLMIHGFDKNGKKVEMKRKRTEDDVAELLERQSKAQETVFDRSDWQHTFIAWAVGDEVSLRRSCSERLRALVTYRNPFVENVLPTDHSTTRRWIIKASQRAKGAIRRCMSKAKSRITLSFDGWRSGNELDMLGVTAHYVDNNYRVKNVLLALRNTYGSHKGEELKYHLLAVCRDYRITARIVYIMADNAHNNDKAIELLKTELGLNPKKCRLRCAGHIINLVTKAILYGADVDCVTEVLQNIDDDNENEQGETVSQFEQALRSKDEVAKLQAWRKRGPIGKLHNIVLHARATPRRREFFASKQKEANPDFKRIYELVVNGGIRWNSTCDMLERAFKLKDAIELYQQEYKDDKDEPLDEDLLTTNDWQELGQLLLLLKPLKTCSKAVQSDGKDCHHGSLFENLQAMDFLLSTLEDLKKKHNYLPDSHFKASINLGWKKLNKYYTLSDDTAAYRAAILLHPHFKMRWFEDKWSDEHPDWILTMKEEVEELYQEYKVRHAEELDAVATAAATEKELTAFERYNLIKDDVYESNELARYLREDRQSADVNPLIWWRNNAHRYPVLKHMAFDHLAAPASSSADERQFSKAGHKLDEDHYNTKDDLAEAEQLTKSAIDEGIDIRLGDGKYLYSDKRRSIY